MAAAPRRGGEWRLASTGPYASGGDRDRIGATAGILMASPRAPRPPPFVQPLHSL